MNGRENGRVVEFFELLNRDGSKLGKVKERNRVHRDGDLHGGSHIWVFRKESDGRTSVLLQKRRYDKDSFPGCYDVSSAGHVNQGEDFTTAALRELEEELNLKVLASDLTFLFSQYVEAKNVFHNEMFFNREINYVYLLNLNVSLETLEFQKEEIEELQWKDADELLKMVREKRKDCCIEQKEYETLYQYLQHQKLKEDASAMKKHNYKITLSYDGTRYNGWQNQKNTSNTIQEKLEELLSKMTGEEIEVIGSGRTDAGAHALGQVANFHMDCEMTDQKILTYMNTYLPKDIAVLKIEQVNGRFHSRLNAVEKIYEYRILNSKIPDVFEHKYEYQVSQKLDLDKMREGARLLTGTHDFKGFCTNKKTNKSTERIIYSIAVQENQDKINIIYRGNGFLYNMIRILSGTLIEIGLGKREPESILKIFENKERTEAGFKAPAQGLFLAGVGYDIGK